MIFQSMTLKNLVHIKENLGDLGTWETLLVTISIPDRADRESATKAQNKIELKAQYHNTSGI